MIQRRIEEKKERKKNKKNKERKGEMYGYLDKQTEITSNQQRRTK